MFFLFLWFCHKHINGYKLSLIWADTHLSIRAVKIILRTGANSMQTRSRMNEWKIKNGTNFYRMVVKVIAIYSNAVRFQFFFVLFLLAPDKVRSMTLHACMRSLFIQRKKKFEKNGKTIRIGFIFILSKDHSPSYGYFIWFPISFQL